MAISVVNGYVCIVVLRCVQARKGEDPHPHGVDKPIRR